MFTDSHESEQLNISPKDKHDRIRGNSKKVIICATQRCGSTLVCNDFLNNGIGRPEELFLGLVNRSNVSNPFHLLNNVHQAGTNKEQIFSVKLMSSYNDKINSFLLDLGYGQNTQGFWSGIADYFSDAHWVYIQRSSTIRQAVSRLMSTQTGITHAISDKSSEFIPGNYILGADANYNKDVLWNSEDINQYIVDIARENFQWEYFFQENNITPLKLDYENIADNTAYISLIRKWAGLPYQALVNQRNLLKLANQRTEKVIQEFVAKKTSGDHSQI